MVIDLQTGGVWTPGTDFVRSMYNLGRYVDDTKGELIPDGTGGQGPREAEFNRWLANELSNAYFRGAESMVDQVEEDHRIRVRPEFASLYGGTEYKDWKATHDEEI